MNAVDLTRIDGRHGEAVELPPVNTGKTPLPSKSPGKRVPRLSPDFNPIERLCVRLKADWSWDFIARAPQNLSDCLGVARWSFVNDSAKTAANISLRK